jgi:aminopeptidase N
MCLRLLNLILVAASCGFASAPEGVPRDLARERAAQVSDLRYHLSFVLTPHSSTSSGHERITFALRAAQPVLLDFRDGAVISVEVNGTPVVVKQEGGHLELPEDRLRVSENTVLA